MTPGRAAVRRRDPRRAGPRRQRGRPPRRAPGLRRRRRHGWPRPRRRGERVRRRGVRAAGRRPASTPRRPPMRDRRDPARCHDRIDEYDAAHHAARRAALRRRHHRDRRAAGRRRRRALLAGRQPRRLPRLPVQPTACSRSSASTTAWCRSWSTPAPSPQPMRPAIPTGTSSPARSAARRVEPDSSCSRSRVSERMLLCSDGVSGMLATTTSPDPGASTRTRATPPTRWSRLRWRPVVATTQPPSSSMWWDWPTDAVRLRRAAGESRGEAGSPAMSERRQPAPGPTAPARGSPSFGAHITVLLPASEKARVATLWALVDGGAGFDARCSTGCSQSGLSRLPGLRARRADDDGPTRVLLRGAASGARRVDRRRRP